MVTFPKFIQTLIFHLKKKRLILFNFFQTHPVLFFQNKVFTILRKQTQYSTVYIYFSLRCNSSIFQTQFLKKRSNLSYLEDNTTIFSMCLPFSGQNGRGSRLS